jgi:hypothetical protein
MPMRRDVYIENDSGGFSVVAADAVDAIIEDHRNDDARFVTGHKALLLELYGDDSMIVRIVVDEPLRDDEQAQWLARASWRIDTTDGRMLAMGGFDPDVLSWWKDGGGQGDGRGVALFEAAPGSWRVDVYAHVGSMNGRAVIDEETGETAGAAFRRSHPGRSFPLWLAKHLEYSGDEDPGHEELWKDVRASVAAGTLSLDMASGDPVGMLVHVTPLQGEMGPPPEEIWVGRSENARLPDPFPVGLPSEVVDGNLEHFRDTLLDRKKPEAPRPIASGFRDLIESWPGDPLSATEGGAVELPLADLYFLHWIAALTADSPPRFELWVEPSGAWTPPAATPDYSVATKAGTILAIGPVENTGGWHTWWAARDVASALPAIPDGSTITFATLRTSDDAWDDVAVPEVGRTLYEGTMQGGRLRITQGSPRVTATVLTDALSFVSDMVRHSRIAVRPGAERAAFDAGLEMAFTGPEALSWSGDVVTLREPDDRTLILLATPVFRARFAAQWAMDAEEEVEDEDE